LGFTKYEMNITKTPKEMYISATDLFGIDELYSKVPDTLLHPRENKKVPKKIGSIQL